MESARGHHNRRSGSPLGVDQDDRLGGKSVSYSLEPDRGGLNVADALSWRRSALPVHWLCPAKSGNSPGPTVQNYAESSFGVSSRAWPARGPDSVSAEAPPVIQ